MVNRNNIIQLLKYINRTINSYSKIKLNNFKCIMIKNIDRVKILKGVFIMGDVI